MTEPVNTSTQYAIRLGSYADGLRAMPIRAIYSHNIGTFADRWPRTTRWADAPTTEGMNEVVIHNATPPSG